MKINDEQVFIAAVFYFSAFAPLLVVAVLYFKKKMPRWVLAVHGLSFITCT